MSAPHTVADLLLLRAAEKPDAVAYTFLVDGEREGSRFTYGQLDRDARAIAAALHARGLRVGDRALLLFPPGLDFVAAFFGCMYAGVIAVPSFPPHPAQLARTLPRLVAIATDAELSAVLTSAAIAPTRNDPSSSRNFSAARFGGGGMTLPLSSTESA